MSMDTEDNVYTLPQSPATPTRVDEEFPVEETTSPSAADEVERLVPDPKKPFTLSDGTRVVAKPLKLRELLAALKIVTRGATMAMGGIRFDLNDEAFIQSMLGLFLFAIPEAEEEVVEFLQVMLEPAGPFATKEEKQNAQDRLEEVLDNPDLEDVLSVVEAVIRRESKDLRSLGKRLENMLSIAQKTGQISR